MSDPSKCPQLNSSNKTGKRKKSQSEEWKTELECPKCKEKCDNKTAFIDHLQSHEGSLKHCINCQTDFHNSLAFKFHKQLSNCVNSNKTLQCNLCNKNLYGESQYINHINAHKLNQCQICGEHFARRKHLEAHRQVVHKVSSDKDIYKCNKCDRTFAQRRSLVYHFKITHPEDGFMCPVCLSMFQTDSEMKAHHTTHKVQLLTCDTCKEHFTRRQQYLIHLKSHERYKCNTCSESFSAKKSAMSHAKIGHDVSGLDFQRQCAECGELFVCRDQFSAHMLLHTGGKRLYCEKCKIFFSRERNYRNHLETIEHLQGEELKTLTACKICNKTFTNKSNLRVHMFRMHRDTKVHSCTYCPFKTKQLANLKRHIARHTEKHQFICDACGAQLHSKQSLQEHQARLHSETKPTWTCDKCGNGFRSLSDLNKHLSTTHSEIFAHSCHCGKKYKTPYSLQRHQFINHTGDNTKLAKKLLPPEKKKSTVSKKKVKKPKSNKVPNLRPKEPCVTSTVSREFNPITERHPSQELLEVPYNMEFPRDKTQVVYSDNIDMSGLHVIQLDSDTSKEGSSVLINVQNLLTHSLVNDYVISGPLEGSQMVNVLADSLSNPLQHTQSQKQDVVLGLQQYFLPGDLNFLNVE